MRETISFGCHFETNDRGSKTSLSTESFFVIVYGKEDLIYSALATFDQVYAPRHHAQYVRRSSSTDNEASHL